MHQENIGNPFDFCSDVIILLSFYVFFVLFL